MSSRIKYLPYSHVGDINTDSKKQWSWMNWDRLRTNFGLKNPGCTEFDAADSTVYKGQEKMIVSAKFSRFVDLQYDQCVSHTFRRQECITNGMKPSTRKGRGDNDDCLPGSLDGACNRQNDRPAARRVMAVCVVPEPGEVGAGDILAPFPLPPVATVAVVAPPAAAVVPVIRAPLALPLKKRFKEEEQIDGGALLPPKKRVRFDVSPPPVDVELQRQDAAFDAVVQRVDAELAAVEQRLDAEFDAVVQRADAEFAATLRGIRVVNIDEHPVLAASSLPAFLTEISNANVWLRRSIWRRWVMVPGLLA